MNPSNDLSSEKSDSNKVESKDIFKNLKSDYFLQKLFDNLQKKKSLDITKYNKAIQKRIELNVNDYKKYSEIYSSIEIEILTNKNEYGNFINIHNNENERYFHIYFNNNKEEIKRNYLNKNDKINNIKIIIDYQVTSFKGLFAFCKSIESIYFKRFVRNNIIDMYWMFYGCSFIIKENKNFKF